MAHRRTAVFAISVSLVLASCGGSSSPARQTERTTTTRAPSLWLGHYDLDLKTQIERFGDECHEMQEAFDWVDRASDGLRRKYGSNGIQIMRLLDKQMRAKGCYD